MNTLHLLALLEGTPSSIEEAEKLYGIKLAQIPSFFVKIGYPDAKAACLSGDPEKVLKGKQVMLALADLCYGFVHYCVVLGREIEAAQAAEIEGTAAFFAGDEAREERIAIEWCCRLTGEQSFPDVVRKASEFEEGVWLIVMKFVLKWAKFLELGLPERWELVEAMASREHPDTLGRALWAIEVAPNDVARFRLLQGLAGRVDFTKIKQDQVVRFQARLAELPPPSDGVVGD